ncbi:substrate-binding domain-containing protein [Leifsonia sp. H3M29-4]|uniref:substrate-binding domain-containing protein n=1 Tax=Salinibacterium metalliresistens TaxID=3031321 RepID=UPI0023DC4083|nr:substrate-binding domain-containing protein [Salinibacterium metalliresistens]MDF1478310.1 substrate-binding domain-containing protein [Salinibacterium metalliresistens]
MYSKTRISLVALAAAGALALAACSTGAGDGGSGGSTAPVNEVGISGVQGDILDISEFCGDQPIKVAFADGFGGNSWRKTTRAIFEAEAAKCENITDIIYTDAQADTQKAISDINSLVAQGVNVIVSFTDGGEALLPTIRKATEAGVKFVPIIACPGGEPGVDYVDCVSENVDTYGYGLALWTIDQMGGKGNLLMTGGQAGNPYSQAVYDGVKRAVAENPDIVFLNEQLGDTFVDTGWEPGKTKQVMAGLITQFGQIDGIVADYGGGSVGGIEAFVDAGKPLPVWSANDSNQFACLWYQYKDSQPTFQIATMSSRNWVAIPALHKGLAAFNGLPNSEPSIFNLEIIEDSTNPDMMPVCEEDLPNDAINSSGLSVEQLKALFNE